MHFTGHDRCAGGGSSLLCASRSLHCAGDIRVERPAAAAVCNTRCQQFPALIWPNDFCDSREMCRD
jgi:hypothetical protein